MLFYFCLGIGLMIGLAILDLLVTLHRRPQFLGEVMSVSQGINRKHGSERPSSAGQRALFVTIIVTFGALVWPIVACTWAAKLLQSSGSEKLLAWLKKMDAELDKRKFEDETS